MSKLSSLAIIVTFNGARTIRRCLESLTSVDPQCEVLVVDNASSDDTPKIVREFPMVKLICLSRNLGFGKGNNVGICKALEWGFEYILLVNQDAYLEGVAIAKLREALEADREILIASPMHMAGDQKSLDLNFSKNLAHRGVPQLLSDLYCSGSTCNLKPTYAVDFVPAAIWMMRSEVFCRLGGFDPLFPHYGEDTDFCIRAEFHRQKIVVVPAARACHLRISAPPEGTSLWRSVSRAAGRYFVSYLTTAKDIRTGPFVVVTRIVRDLLKDLNRVVVRRDLLGFVGAILAITRLLCAGMLIVRSRSVSRMPASMAYLPSVLPR